MKRDEILLVTHRLHSKAQHLNELNLRRGAEQAFRMYACTRYMSATRIDSFITLNEEKFNNGLNAKDDYVAFLKAIAHLEFIRQLKNMVLIDFAKEELGQLVLPLASEFATAWEKEYGEKNAEAMVFISELISIIPKLHAHYDKAVDEAIVGVEDTAASPALGVDFYRRTRSWAAETSPEKNLDGCAFARAALARQDSGARGRRSLSPLRGRFGEDSGLITEPATGAASGPQAGVGSPPKAEPRRRACSWAAETSPEKTLMGFPLARAALMRQESGERGRRFPPLPHAPLPQGRVDESATAGAAAGVASVLRSQGTPLPLSDEASAALK